MPHGARLSERPTELRRRLVAWNQPRHRDGDEGRDLAEQPLLQAEGAKAALNLYRMTLYARKIVLDKSNDDTAKKRRLRKGEAKSRAGGA